MENGLKRWQEENNRLTKEGCYRLLRRLKEQQLDPILTRLSSKDGASVTFAQIIGGYSAIEQGFKRDAKGAKDVRAQVFYEFHPVGLSWEYILRCRKSSILPFDNRHLNNEVGWKKPKIVKSCFALGN